MKGLQSVWAEQTLSGQFYTSQSLFLLYRRDSPDFKLAFQVSHPDSLSNYQYAPVQDQIIKTFVAAFERRPSSISKEKRLSLGVEDGADKGDRGESERDRKRRKGAAL